MYVLAQNLMFRKKVFENIIFTDFKIELGVNKKAYFN